MGGSRRQENTEATRRAIMKAARRVFGRRGYDGASLEAITAGARVTTGALYHHFESKEGLFRAVAEAVEAEILSAVVAAGGREMDPWRGLLAGVEAMLALASDADIRQIAFVDAPRVIGPVEWRQIEARYAFGLMRQAMTRLITAGVLKPLPPELAATIVLGALIEAAQAVAQAGGSEEARAQARDVIEAMLDGLKS